MARKRELIRYKLESTGIKHLTDEEIRAVLRGADELIMTGGRNMLAKILKGSKDKKLLEYGLDSCPSYGYYKEMNIEEIIKRIDWMIQRDYLEIEYRRGGSIAGKCCTCRTACFQYLIY